MIHELSRTSRGPGSAVCFLSQRWQSSWHHAIPALVSAVILSLAMQLGAQAQDAASLRMDNLNHLVNMLFFVLKIASWGFFLLFFSTAIVLCFGRRGSLAGRMLGAAIVSPIIGWACKYFVDCVAMLGQGAEPILWGITMGGWSTVFIFTIGALVLPSVVAYQRRLKTWKVYVAANVLLGWMLVPLPFLLGLALMSKNTPPAPTPPEAELSQLGLETSSPAVPDLDQPENSSTEGASPSTGQPDVSPDSTPQAPETEPSPPGAFIAPTAAQQIAVPDPLPESTTSADPPNPSLEISSESPTTVERTEGQSSSGILANPHQQSAEPTITSSSWSSETASQDAEMIPKPTE